MPNSVSPMQMNGVDFCPPGYRLRKGYSVGSTFVAPRCIPTTTSHRQSAKNFQKEAKKKMTTRKRGIPILSRGNNTVCPSGQILRNSYVRKITKSGKRVFVPASCINDIGAPGEGLSNGKPGIGQLHKGELSKYGYTNIAEMKMKDRRKALKKAIIEYGPLGVWRKLNALAVYTRRTSPETSEHVSSDMKWIRSKFDLTASP